MIIGVGVLFTVVTVTMVMLRHQKLTTIDYCKEMVNEYFKAYNACDYSDIMLVIDDELEQSYGEADKLKERIMARRMLLGECVRYEITEICYKKMKNNDAVSITYRAMYENQSPITETMMFLTFHRVPVITGLDLGRECVVDDVVTRFFDAYHLQDFQSMIDCFNPIYFDYTSEKSLQNIIISIEKAAGELDGFEPLEEYYYCHPISSSIMCVYTGLYCAEYQHEKMMVEIELCVQNDTVGINYLNFSPYVD